MIRQLEKERRKIRNNTEWIRRLGERKDLEITKITAEINKTKTEKTIEQSIN